MTQHKTALPPIVLLVDDSEAILEIYGEVLTDAGIRVRVASNGQQAIEQALSQQPDVIVMDLKMPGVDGFETTRRLKADPRTSAIPVLAFTGDATVDDEARAADCAGIIRKPCTADDFLDAIEEQLRR